MSTDPDANDIEARAAEYLTAQQYLLLRLNANIQNRQVIPALVAWAHHTAQARQRGDYGR